MKSVYLLMIVCCALIFQSCGTSRASTDEKTNSATNTPKGQTSNSSELVATDVEDLFFYFLKYKRTYTPKYMSLATGRDNLAEDFLMKFKTEEYSSYVMANDFQKKKILDDIDAYITQKLSEVDLEKPIILKSYCTFDKYDFEQSAFHIYKAGLRRSKYLFDFSFKLSGSLPLQPALDDFVKISPEKAENLIGDKSKLLLNQWVIAHVIKGEDDRTYLKLDKVIYTDPKTETVAIEQNF